MTQSIRSGGVSSLPAPQLDRLKWGKDVQSTPASPSKRVPVIDRSKVDPQIVKAAEGMEALFIDYMMKVMRETVPKSDMDLESPATEIYRGMMDTEFAQKAAHHGGIGLADQIISYLTPEGYNNMGRDIGEGQGAQVKEKP
jgi:flagellar protein FlgJ